MWGELGLLHGAAALRRLLALSQWSGRAQLFLLSGGRVPLFKERSLLPPLRPLQLPEPLPQWFRREELFLLSARKLPLQGTETGSTECRWLKSETRVT